MTPETHHEISSLDKPTRDDLQRRLQAFQRRSLNEEVDSTPAAVAIVVNNSAESNALQFLLTLRAARLNNHGGQFALPGGRVDDGETAVQAAIRELHEELGIALSEENIIGILDDYATRSGYCVTPVVLWSDRLDSIKASPAEVAKVFQVPVSDLGHADNPVLTEIPQSSRPVLSMQLDSIGQQVFSPTAAMLYQFHEVAIHARSTRVAQYEQPVFAWK